MQYIDFFDSFLPSVFGFVWDIVFVMRPIHLVFNQSIPIQLSKGENNCNFVCLIKNTKNMSNSTTQLDKNRHSQSHSSLQYNITNCISKT